MRRAQSWLLGIGLFVVGCAASGGLADEPGTLRYDLGVADKLLVQNDLVRWITERFQYQIYRFDQSMDDLYLETLWKSRLPVADEPEADEVRTRLIVRGRPRGKGSTAAELQVLTLEVQYQVRRGPQWVSAVPSPQALSQIRAMANDLKDRIATALRSPSGPW
ncbi:MAG: hypothetical protein RML47_08360 [Bacteroidota bacterium]|nr:hypothetical protein [Rhodothermia bacterium]MCS7155065.1 hypothetical protein [Bacteroidota bacterium]MDW8138758.1 hypothetical protein [Bacteroidota bacterium]MDW8286093.1 hypothetical protein [Bacteroidota bacterium]